MSDEQRWCTDQSCWKRMGLGGQQRHPWHDVRRETQEALAGVHRHPEQREREARPKESAACPAWEDGQHLYSDLGWFEEGGTKRFNGKVCACGKTIGRKT